RLDRRQRVHAPVLAGPGRPGPLAQAAQLLPGPCPGGPRQLPGLRLVDPGQQRQERLEGGARGAGQPQRGRGRPPDVLPGGGGARGSSRSSGGTGKVSRYPKVMNPREPMRSTVWSPASRACTCSASAGSAPAHSGGAVGKTSVECIAGP